jgi:hypothetical protein
VDGNNNTVTLPVAEELTREEILAASLAPVGDSLVEVVGNNFNKPHTISAPAGMPFSIVFVSTVTTEDIKQ